MGRYEEARGRLDEAFRIDPADLYVRMQMGKLHLLTDKNKEAVREYRAAAAIDPKNPDAHKALAIALIEAGELAGAERVLRAAIRQLDASQGWELRLTLCQLLARLGDDIGDDRYYEEALREATTAVRLKPRQPGPHFYAGIVRFKIDDLPGALRSFKQCLSLDKENVMAELNAERIRARLREKSQARVSRFSSIFLMVVFIILLAVLWAPRVWTEKISETTFVVLTPVLLGLLVVSVLLPWLTRLKITGIEAELSEPKPKETLPSGPRREIGFIRDASKGL
jgi:tetratricopeptide (TPR) repeat protein